MPKSNYCKVQDHYIMYLHTKYFHLQSGDSHTHTQEMADANPKATRILALRKTATKDPPTPNQV